MYVFHVDGEVKIVKSSKPLEEAEINELGKEGWRFITVLSFEGIFYFYFIFRIDN
jgi:hypothetical protein